MTGYGRRQLGGDGSRDSHMTTDVTEEHLGVIEATLTESVAKAAEGLTALAALRRALRAA